MAPGFVFRWFACWFGFTGRLSVKRTNTLDASSLHKLEILHIFVGFLTAIFELEKVGSDIFTHSKFLQRLQTLILRKLLGKFLQKWLLNRATFYSRNIRSKVQTSLEYDHFSSDFAPDIAFRAKNLPTLFPDPTKSLSMVIQAASKMRKALGKSVQILPLTNLLSRSRGSSNFPGSRWFVWFFLSFIRTHLWWIH